MIARGTRSVNGYRFLVPEEVVAEITEPTQQHILAVAFDKDYMERISIDTIESLRIFAELRAVMGLGEAACLSLATTRGVWIGSDEKKRFRRKAIELIGERKIIQTRDLLLAAIHQEKISVTEADRFKQVLAQNRYAMAFGSFEELL